MNRTLIQQVIRVGIEFTEQESDDLNYWFGNRDTVVPEDAAKFRRGEDVMINLCKQLRDGFHSDKNR